MSNKLPKVFANKIEKKLNNNKEVYTSINTEKEETTKKQTQKNLVMDQEFWAWRDDKMTSLS